MVASPAPTAGAEEARFCAHHLGTLRQELVQGVRSLFEVVDVTGIIELVIETMEFYHNMWLSEVHVKSFIESLLRLFRIKWIIV